VPNKSRDSVLMAMGNGAVAGLAGTVVMTAFQRLVEMPATGRKESYAPADLVMKLSRWPRSASETGAASTTSPTSELVWPGGWATG